MISSKNSSTSSTSTLGAQRRRKHMKNKVDNDDASTLYLDWSNHSTSTTQQTAASATSSMLTTSASARTSTDSIRSLSSAKNLISLSLQQEKEQTELESANRSSRSIGSVLRRNPSERKRNLPNSNSIGLRLSELTSLSASSQCDDDDYDDDESKASTTVGGDDEPSFTSGRTIFHTIANRVKMASSSSTNNLAAITELSNDLLADNRSNYFKNRVSIRVRRASDLLFSSHHRKDLEDEVHEEDF